MEVRRVHAFARGTFLVPVKRMVSSKSMSVPRTDTGAPGLEAQGVLVIIQAREFGKLAPYLR